MLSELKRFHELDRTMLKDKDMYADYFSYLRTSFELVLNGYHLDTEGNQDEVALIKYFLQKFLNSLECLRMKYLFSNEHQQMKIDQSDSSFPHNIELMNLQDDITRRDEKLAKLLPAKTLFKELVEWVYVRLEQPVELQRKIASRLYNELLNSPENLYYTYTPGELTKLENESENNRMRYVYTWSTYEASLNVPLLYQMIFEIDAAQLRGKTFNVNYDPEFVSVIKHASRSNYPLADVAGGIDVACATIFPKEIKRLTIGPLYGKYSLHDNPLSQIVHGAKTKDPFALAMRREIVSSSGERISKKLLVKKSVYQLFNVSHVSNETLNSKVTNCSDVLFTPHHIAQRIVTSNEVKEKTKKIKIISLTTTNEDANTTQ